MGASLKKDERVNDEFPQAPLYDVCVIGSGPGEFSEKEEEGEREEELREGNSWVHSKCVCVTCDAQVCAV